MDSLKLSQLPSEYQAVEYIENLDDAWVLIQYIPQQYDEISVTFAFNGDHSHSNCLFSVGNGTRQLICLSFRYLSKNAFYYKYFASGSAKELSTGIDDNEWSTLKIDNDGTVHWNGNNVQSPYEGELDGSDGLNLRIFKRANQTYPFIGKISEFFIQRNGVYQVYLIPCYRKADNVVGFYDIESNTFYASSGTSQFVTGGEIQFVDNACALLHKRKMIMMQTDILPPKYQRVEYLQTVGSESYINTGVAGNDNTIQIDLTVEPLSKLNYAQILGNHDAEDKTCWRLIQGHSNYPNAYNMTLNYRRASGSPGVIIRHLDDILNHIVQIHMEYEYGYAICDGIKYDVNKSSTSVAQQSTLNIVIGRTGPNKSGSRNAPSHRFYDFRIHKQGKLIRNYIPCYRKSDDKAGFYDLVNHTFNPSIGALDFIIPS